MNDQPSAPLPDQMGGTQNNNTETSDNPSGPKPQSSNRKVLLIALAGVVVLGILGGAYALFGRPSEPAVTQRTIKVGLMAPLSGSNAAGGLSQQHSIELAMKDVSIEGVTIELIAKDTGCDADKAKAAAEELINADHVVAIIGDACSGATLAAAPLANERHVVLISQASSSPAITDAGDYVFRTTPSDTFQGDVAARLIDQAGLERLAIIYGNESYGTGLQSVIKDKFTKLGGTVVASEAIEPATTDVAAALDRIKATNPTAIYVANNSLASIAAILLRAQAVGLSAKLYGSEALKDQAVITDAAGASEGLTVTAVSAGTTTFASKYRNAYKTEAASGANGAQAYDAMFAIAQALKQGATTGEEIKTKLYKVQFDGSSGHIQFDANGDISTSNYDIFVVKDRQFVPSTVKVE